MEYYAFPNRGDTGDVIGHITSLTLEGIEITRDETVI